MTDILLIIASAVWVKLIVAIVDQALFGVSAEALSWAGKAMRISPNKALARAVISLVLLLLGVFVFAALDNYLYSVQPAQHIAAHRQLYTFMAIVWAIDVFPPFFSRKIGDDS
ncbi:MAG: hypothetical protein GXO56_01695 [Chloroflexi bacterium]|nr:hypothetical protein [Chloroflexota bacterium]